MAKNEMIPVHNVTANEMLFESDTFCMLPFVSQHLTPDGKVLPCCIGNLSTGKELGRKDLNLEGMVNSDVMKELRLDMIQGNKNSICNTCYKTEEARSGMYSFRNTANSKWGADYVHEVLRNTDDTGKLHNFKMRYFDFRLSNVCNFKCRSCNSGYSTLWQAEDAKQGIPSSIDIMPERNKSLLEEVLEHIPHMQEAYFAGGEPVVDENHYIILEELLRQGRTDVQLNYNTNLSRLKFKDYDLLALWSQFEKPVDVYSSIDHYGERAEYIRNGTKWEDVENNIKTLLMEPNVNLQISTTVSMLNYLTLEEFYLYMLKKGLMPGGDWQLNPVFNPSHFSVMNFPEEFKEKGRKQVQNIIDFCTSDHYTIDKYRRRNFDFDHTVSNIKNFPNLVDNTDSQWDSVQDKFRSETARLDNMRNEDFVKTFPELAELYTG